MRFLLLSALVACFAQPALGGIIAPDADAVATYSFKNITNNNAIDAAIGEAQMSVQLYGWDPTIGPHGAIVTGAAAQSATSTLFVFRNIGNHASSIVQVYFEDGALLGISDLIDADDPVDNPALAGVDFTEGKGSPPNLPGGHDQNAPNLGGKEFLTTAGFLMDADPKGGKMHNGINESEELGVIFELKPGFTTQKLIDSIELALNDPSAIRDPHQGGIDVTPTLRIGIHVQGYDGGGSESFVNGGQPGSPGPTIVPEPTSLLLLFAGAILILLYRQLKHRRLQPAAAA